MSRYRLFYKGIAFVCQKKLEVWIDGVYNNHNVSFCDGCGIEYNEDIINTTVIVNYSSNFKNAI